MGEYSYNQVYGIGTLLDSEFRGVTYRDFVTDFSVRGVNFRTDYFILEFFRRKKSPLKRESNPGPFRPNRRTYHNGLLVS